VENLKIVRNIVQHAYIVHSTYLVARAKMWPVAWLLISQSLRIPFLPDAPTHVSISTTSPLTHVKFISSYYGFLNQLYASKTKISFHQNWYKSQSNSTWRGTHIL